jgi:gamma-glutamylcyclotransferase (GGCT)/AIG2-like uncharacterized protein YtfP
MASPSPDLVFVYGSLKRGFYNHGLLERAEFFGAALTEACYRLIDLGPHPAMIETNVDPLVVFGELYRIDAQTLARLDKLEEEGVAYRRVVAPIMMLDGPGCDQSIVRYQAWTYLWLGVVDSQRILPDGLWRETATS